MQFAVVHPEHEDACSLLWYKEWKLRVLQNGSHAMIELYIELLTATNHLSCAKLNVLPQATTATYDSSKMCNSPASDYGWREPGLLHTAVLEK